MSAFDGHSWPEPVDPGPEDNPAADDAYEERLHFTRDVSDELRRLKVRQAAQDALRAESEPEAPPFDAGTLGEVLARPADPPMRAEGLVPSAASVLVVAQRKTGKTTLDLNYARALLTGQDFLGRFPVRPIEGTVAILNYEVSAAMLARWADEHGIDRDRLYLVNLRGRRNPLSHPGDRALLAADLRGRGVEVLIVDPFGRAYTGVSQNNPGEVGAFLVDLDMFARSEVGVSDLILSAHAGWNGERTRGSSALEDWADVIITLTRDAEDESQRFMRATGRDVDVEEDRLDFDPATRTLTLAGTGSRKQAASTRHLEELLPAVLDAVAASPGITGYGLDKALREAGEGLHNGDGAKAARLGVDRQQLRVEDGPRNSKRFHRATSPDLPPTSPGGGHPTSPTSLIGEVGGGEVVNDPPPPTGEVTACDTCGQPLLLHLPGRDTCGACTDRAREAS